MNFYDIHVGDLVTIKNNSHDLGIVLKLHIKGCFYKIYYLKYKVARHIPFEWVTKLVG